jgi:hypothetical protein
MCAPARPAGVPKLIDIYAEPPSRSRRGGTDILSVRVPTMSEPRRSPSPSRRLNVSEWGAVAFLMTFLVVWFGSAFA